MDRDNVAAELARAYVDIENAADDRVARFRSPTNRFLLESIRHA